MRYPVYLELPGTKNVYVVEGPESFVEWQRVGERWMKHKVWAATWPDRQRILDMVADDSPWETISRDALASRVPASTLSEPMTIQEHVDLSPLTTFGVPAKARWYAKVSSVDALREALAWASDQGVDVMMLGGGSNMLFHADVEALVIHLAMRGVEVVEDDGRRLTVAAGAGEGWHSFVMATLEQGWGGLENLSLIPGNVGASPMQNIGAYGVEIKDRFAWLEAVRIADGALKRFDASSCEFGYRESVFKRNERGKWAIVRVAFHLDRESPLVMGYGALEQELAAIPNDRRTHRDVSEAVIRIRQSKLPDPDVLGNAGSFFKNPTVPASLAESIAAQHPTMPQYPQGDGRVKLAAGWLIEQAGWKGHDRETHGVHDKQALVLVNKGGARGPEIWQLACDVMASVKAEFGVSLEPEVNQIGLMNP